MKRRNWFVGLCSLFGSVAAADRAIAQPSPGTLRDRLDFTAAAGQTTYPTAPVSPATVEVYRNGLLQRLGADYTQARIQNGTRIRVTFNAPPGDGDYITLFYYR